MPLLDLKTKLKDLKFGTLAPYIQKDINNPGLPSAGQIQARGEDLERMAKMLADRPGIEFTTKQIALEASKAERLSDVFNKNTLINPGLRIANILAQVPVNRTGTHFLALGGGPLTNYYTRNANASAEALLGNTVKVSRGSVIRYSSSDLASRNYSLDLMTQTLATGEVKSRLKKVELGVKTSLVDTRSRDAVNLLDVGMKDTTDSLLNVSFSILGKPDTTMNTFRGYVQSISDNYQANWQGVNYVGRMEQFFTYTGFTRTFNFQLVIPIFSDVEQPRVFNKINSLVSYTAPTYVNNLPQGSIVYMTMGNYLRTAGIINSVGITVVNDVPWSHSTPDAYGNGEARLLPQVITANIQFTPIHSKAPELHVSPFNTSTPNGPYINQGTSKVNTTVDTAGKIDIAPIDDTGFEEVDLLEEFRPLLQQLDFGALFRGRTSRLGGPTSVIEVGEGFFGNDGTYI